MKRTIPHCIFALLLAAPLAAQSITVTAPGLQASWCLGSLQTITWTSSGVSGPVVITLRSPDQPHAAPLLMIASRADNVGSFAWTIPATLAPGAYQVRVGSLSAESLVFGDSGKLTIQSCAPAGRNLPDYRTLPPPHPFFAPKLAVTSINLVRNAGGYGIIFGYKNVGTGALPKRSQLTVKPDYRVLIDDREIDQGDLFIPESPPAGPGWEVTTFSGGSIQFPVYEPHPWSIGDRITILLNERNALDMGTATKSSALRLIALTAGYDLAFSGPAVIDWNANKARVTITKVGSLPEKSKKFFLNCGVSYYHQNTMGSGGANEGVVYVPSGPYQENRSLEFPITGPFPLHADIVLDPTSPYYVVEFRIRTDGRDQFDERNDSLPPVRFERPGIPAGPRIQSVSFAPYTDSHGDAKLRTVIALRNESGRAWGGLHLVMKRNDSKVGEWQGFGLGAGAGSNVTHYGPPAGYNNTFNFYLYDAANHLIDSRQEIYY